MALAARFAVPGLQNETARPSGARRDVRGLMKKVDTFEYFTVLREMTEQGAEVQVRISGNSMMPFLANQRDFIFFKKPDRALKRGDIVAYQRSNGQYIVHRICKIRPEGYYIIGDAQTQVEGPVKDAQIFAVITKVNRKGKWIGPNDFWWKFFAGFWLHIIPMRHAAIKVYSWIRRKLPSGTDPS